MATVPAFQNPFPAKPAPVAATPAPGPRPRHLRPRPAPVITLTDVQVAAIKTAPTDKPVNVTLNVGQIDAIHMHTGSHQLTSIGPDGWPRDRAAWPGDLAA